MRLHPTNSMMIKNSLKQDVIEKNTLVRLLDGLWYRRLQVETVRGDFERDEKHEYQELLEEGSHIERDEEQDHQGRLEERFPRERDEEHQDTGLLEERLHQKRIPAYNVDGDTTIRNDKRRT